MKQILFISLPLFFAAALCMCLTSCGGGDDDSGSGPQTQQQNGGGNGGETNGGVNDPQYSQQLGTPLTLEAIGNGTITFKNRAAGNVMYKVDNGATQTIAPGADGNIPV
ncbi:MAG: hypothetical protein IJQ59_02485, partial [Bacteroidaceae bacterium]|nr:hypothetical protein [Bacteroidaceae bacterium]